MAAWVPCGTAHRRELLLFVDALPAAAARTALRWQLSLWTGTGARLSTDIQLLPRAERAGGAHAAALRATVGSSAEDEVWVCVQALEDASVAGFGIVRASCTLQWSQHDLHVSGRRLRRRGGESGGDASIALRVHTRVCAGTGQHAHSWPAPYGPKLCQWTRLSPPHLETCDLLTSRDRRQVFLTLAVLRRADAHESDDSHAGSRVCRTAHHGGWPWTGYDTALVVCCAKSGARTAKAPADRAQTQSCAVLWASTAKAPSIAHTAVQLTLPSTVHSDPNAELELYFLSVRAGGESIVHAVAAIPLYPRRALFLPDGIHKLCVRAPPPADIELPTFSYEGEVLRLIRSNHTQPKNSVETAGSNKACCEASASFQLHVGTAVTRVVQHEALLDFALSDCADMQLLAALRTLRLRRLRRGESAAHILDGVLPLQAFCLRVPFVRRIVRLWLVFCSAETNGSACASKTGQSNDALPILFELYADFITILLSDDLCEASLARAVHKTLWVGDIGANDGDKMRHTASVHHQFLQQFCSWLCHMTGLEDENTVNMHRSVAALTVLCSAASAAAQPGDQGSFLGPKGANIALHALCTLWRRTTQAGNTAKMLEHELEQWQRRLVSATSMLLPACAAVLVPEATTPTRVTSFFAELCCAQISKPVQCLVLRVLGHVYIDAKTVGGTLSSWRLRVALLPIIASFVDRLFLSCIAVACEDDTELMHTALRATEGVVRMHFIRGNRPDIRVLEHGERERAQRTELATLTKLCSTIFSVASKMDQAQHSALELQRCTIFLVKVLSSDEGSLLRSLDLHERPAMCRAAARALNCSRSYAELDSSTEAMAAVTHARDQLVFIRVFACCHAADDLQSLGEEVTATESFLQLLGHIMATSSCDNSLCLDILQLLLQRLTRVHVAHMVLSAPSCRVDAAGRVAALASKWCSHLMQELVQLAQQGESDVGRLLHCLCDVQRLEQSNACIVEEVGLVLSSHALREMLCIMRAAACTTVTMHPESVLNAELAPSPPISATESALVESGSSRAIAMALLLVADSNALGSGSACAAPSETEFSTDGTHLRAFLRAVYQHMSDVRCVALGHSDLELDERMQSLGSLQALVRLHSTVDVEVCVWLLRTLHAAQWELQEPRAMAYTSLALAQQLVKCQHEPANKPHGDFASDNVTAAVSQALTELDAVGAWEAALGVADDTHEMCASLHNKLGQGIRRPPAFFAVIFCGPTWCGNDGGGPKWYLYLRRAEGGATALAKELADAFPSACVLQPCDPLAMEDSSIDTIQVLPAFPVVRKNGAAVQVHVPPTETDFLSAEMANDLHACFVCFVRCDTNSKGPNASDARTVPEWPRVDQFFLVMEGGGGSDRAPAMLRWALPREQPVWVTRMCVSREESALLWLQLHETFLRRVLQIFLASDCPTPEWAFSSLAFVLELALSPLFTRFVGMETARACIVAAEEAGANSLKQRRRRLKQVFVREKKWCERMGMRITAQPDFERLARADDRTQDLVQSLLDGLQRTRSAMDEALAMLWQVANTSDDRKQLQIVLWLESIRAADAL